MRKLLLFLLSFFAVHNGYAQNSTNYLNLTINNAWNFYMDDVYDLEHDMVINNAFTLRLKTVSKAASVLMRQQILQYPSNFAPNGQGHLAIHFASTNSTNYTNLNTNLYIQTSTNQLLFKQPQMSSSLAERTFTYKLVIIETGYDYFFPGYYTFRGIFTMTQP